MWDSISSRSIQEMTDFAPAAAAFPDPFRLLVRDEAGSTNDDLRSLAEAGSPHGLVLLARRQTAGRGRRGAAWFAGGEDSLAFSILLRPPEPRACWPRLALACGLAVAQAMETAGIEAGIKWPNDVWLGGKKTAGILVEGGDSFVIVGIGVNVNNTAFPREVAGLATSMALAAGARFDPPEVLGNIVSGLAEWSAAIGDAEFPGLIAEVSRRCVLMGETVSLTTAGGRKTGRVLGIGAGGELVLDGAHGVEKILQADEVRIIG